MCGVLNERSGIVNIGIEGMMLAAAFAGWFVASVVAQASPPSRAVLRGTPAILVGSSRRWQPGSCCRSSMPGCPSSVRADQIISGTIINIVAFGLTGYLDR